MNGAGRFFVYMLAAFRLRLLTQQLSATPNRSRGSMAPIRHTKNQRFLAAGRRDLIDLICVPLDIATCLWHTGIEPFSGKEVYVAKGLRDRKMQRALMQFFKPDNWFTVREALIQAGRQDLIGSGCDCLIPAQPPREAWRQSGRKPIMKCGANKWRATTTTPWPTRRRERSRASAASTGATGRDARRRSGGRGRAVQRRTKGSGVVSVDSHAGIG